MMAPLSKFSSLMLVLCIFTTIVVIECLVYKPPMKKIELNTWKDSSIRKTSINKDNKCICDTNHRVFVLGFPKSGTDSLHFLFKKIGCNSLHWDCKSKDIKKCVNMSMFEAENITLYDEWREKTAGYLMSLAYQKNKSLLYFINNRYTIFTQMDLCYKGVDPNLCIWPQLTWFKLLYYQYPDSLFILNYRNIENHIKSINNWYDMRQRFIEYDIPGLPKGIGVNDTDIKNWILLHYHNVEEFFGKYSPQSLLTYDIEQDNVTKLEQFLHCNGLIMPHTHNTRQRMSNNTN